MKITIRIEVSDAIRAALQRHKEAKSLSTKADVTKFLADVCKAAVFTIVEHEDAKRMKKAKPKKKDQPNPVVSNG